jgi:hypothetical protein
MEKKKNRTLLLGFVYSSRRAHKAFWITAMKNRGSFSPSPVAAIPGKIRPAGGRRPVGNGSGIEPRPRGFQFGVAGGRNLTGTVLSTMVCGWPEGNGMEGAADGCWGPVKSGSCLAFAQCSRWQR